MSTFKANPEHLPEGHASIAPMESHVLEDLRRAFPDGTVTLERLRQLLAEAYARDHIDREPLVGEALKLGLGHERDSNLLGHWMSAIVALAKGLESGTPAADAASDFARVARHVKLEIWHRRLFGLEFGHIYRKITLSRWQFLGTDRRLVASSLIASGSHPSLKRRSRSLPSFRTYQYIRVHMSNFYGLLTRLASAWVTCSRQYLQVGWLPQRIIA